MPKKTYKPKNWTEYNKSKVKQGNIFLWLADDITDWWYPKEKTGKKGSPFTYSDRAIELSLMLKHLFRLPFRQNQGFLQGLLDVLSLPLVAPDYSTMSKRGHALPIHLERKPSSEPIDIAIDSSGVRVHSGQDWTQVKHRKKDKKKWLKVHIAVNPENGEIVASSVTGPTESDSGQVKELLEQIPEPIDTVFADGAYDRDGTYEAIEQRPQDGEIEVVIPPIKTSLVPDESKLDLSQREQHILYLSKNIRDKWRSKFRYGQREKSEGAFARLKSRFGERLSSQNIELQKLEICLKIKLLNKMNELYTEGFAR